MVVEAKTSIETGVSQTEVEETVVPEPDKIAPCSLGLKRLELRVA